MKIKVECEECGSQFSLNINIRLFVPSKVSVLEGKKNRGEPTHNEYDIEWHTVAFCPKCHGLKRVIFIKGKTSFLFR